MPILLVMPHPSHKNDPPLHLRPAAAALLRVQLFGMRVQSEHNEMKYPLYLRAYLVREIERLEGANFGY